MISYL